VSPDRAGRRRVHDGLSEWFASAIDQAGLPDECVCIPGQDGRTMLAEVGCTPTIAAIAGHRTLAEVERYAKAADQKRPAAAAMLRLERADPGTPRTEVAP
jgi:hypothetical protein